MMKLALLVMLATGLAVQAAEEPNATATFLGPEDQWSRCGIVLEDIQGLWGGTAVYVDGAGASLIRIVRGADEKRFTLKLATEETLALRKACIDADFLTVQVKERSGVPDEARPKITLRNAEGKTFAIVKWANDKVPRFDQVYNALLAFRKNVENLKPEYEGKRQQDWKPPTATGIKTSMKGWELYVWQKDGETLFALLPGTNRLKTDDEIDKAAVKGFEAIKPKLAELKPGEDLFIVGKTLTEKPPTDQAASVMAYGKTIGLKVQ